MMNSLLASLSHTGHSPHHPFLFFSQRNITPPPLPLSVPILLLRVSDDQSSFPLSPFYPSCSLHFAKQLFQFSSAKNSSSIPLPERVLGSSFPKEFSSSHLSPCLWTSLPLSRSLVTRASRVEIASGLSLSPLPASPPGHLHILRNRRERAREGVLSASRDWNALPCPLPFPQACCTNANILRDLHLTLFSRIFPRFFLIALSSGATVLTGIFLFHQVWLSSVYYIIALIGESNFSFWLFLSIDFRDCWSEFTEIWYSLNIPGRRALVFAPFHCLCVNDRWCE